MWKFISLYLKGSIVVYDVLYLSPTYNNPDMINILNQLREGINNKLGFSSKTYFMNNWKKDRTDQKKIVMSYYRLLQAIIFLRKEEYISNISELWEDPFFNKFIYGKKVFTKFKNSGFEKTRLSEKEITGTARELEQLGYDTYMIFVNTSLDVALERNAKRDRSVPESMVTKLWNQVQSNIGKFNLFFKQGFIIVDNNDAKQDILDLVYKRVKQLLRVPIRNTRAKEWMRMELLKKQQR